MVKSDEAFIKVESCPGRASTLEPLISLKQLYQARCTVTARGVLRGRHTRFFRAHEKKATIRVWGAQRKTNAKKAKAPSAKEKKREFLPLPHYTGSPVPKPKASQQSCPGSPLNAVY